MRMGCMERMGVMDGHDRSAHRPDDDTRCIPSIATLAGILAVARGYLRTDGKCPGLGASLERQLELSFLPPHGIVLVGPLVLSWWLCRLPSALVISTSPACVTPPARSLAGAVLGAVPSVCGPLVSRQARWGLFLSNQLRLRVALPL
jgi:hypothetical protein